MTNVEHHDPANGEYDDDGTMPENVAFLAELVVGHRIVSAEVEEVLESPYGDYKTEALVLTLDTGKRVILKDTSDCCAFTELQSFLYNPRAVDHIITKVTTEEGYSKWHILADFGDVLSLNVCWSSGNPFYYGYGFDILVEDNEKETEND